jgi:hypothetical protein
MQKMAYGNCEWFSMLCFPSLMITFLREAGRGNAGKVKRQLSRRSEKQGKEVGKTKVGLGGEMEARIETAEEKKRK